ncbi:MAG: PaaI family thioesterase [Bacteroidales bacterium]|nr:PaaI family thioesterase [Bacteroidales bacterium]MCM1415892.1 PaaI family thioesterase [bacterium]MCM1423545.1 PaaI family thioesterase [bacterium]
MPTLEEIRERFQKDRFATEAANIVIDAAQPGKAVCSVTLKAHHMNANNVPMGGAIFTLADFACAVAANGHAERVTVSQNASITFLSPAKGKRLIAEASCLRAGRTTGLYAVDIRDELDTYVAHATINAFTVG